MLIIIFYVKLFGFNVITVSIIFKFHLIYIIKILFLFSNQFVDSALVHKYLRCNTNNSKNVILSWEYLERHFSITYIYAFPINLSQLNSSISPILHFLKMFRTLLQCWLVFQYWKTILAGNDNQISQHYLHVFKKM